MTPTGPPPSALPQRHGTRFVTDGGMETDLIYHHGVPLPEFAAFPLLDTQAGRTLLADYYGRYAGIARRAGAGLLLEAGTFRASPDWGARLGYDRADLTRVNTLAITHLAGLRERFADIDPVLISGMVGPRGDGYSAAGRLDPDQAQDYHRPQVEAFAAAGADLVTAYTLADAGEAIGIVRSARSAGLPVAISFTVETDGRLPSGDSIAAAITAVDAAAAPDYYLVNCAHPAHVSAGLGPAGPWRDRIAGIRPNASAKSHAELDEADDLDEGDIGALVAAQAELTAALPALTIVGGCCGTDHRHVAALWGA
ncbi:MAG TPA: homocysteine S-methyltransferase family protein [Streptosporangiaceae bacterium]|jgi:homocysteine S-methyltransferase